MASTRNRGFLCSLAGRMKPPRMLFAGLALTALLLALVSSPQAGDAGERVKIGFIKASFCGPVFLARDKGYFAQEGIEPDLVFFGAGQGVPVAIVSGDIDFGVVGPTAAFYSLAAQNDLRIIGGNHREVPGFQSQVIAVSNRAYAAGLKTYGDFAGHSFVTSTLGSPSHYTLALLMAKYGVDLKSVQVRALQSIPNAISAIVGGQADTTILPVTALFPAIQAEKVRALGWVGDETPFQLGVIVTGRKTADAKPALVSRFLRALRNGAKAYHDAFTDARGHRLDGPTAAATTALIAKYVDQSPEQVARGISYIDADLRIDAKDIRRQVDWFHAQGMVKGKVDVDTLIDQRYALALP